VSAGGAGDGLGLMTVVAAVSGGGRAAGRLARRRTASTAAARRAAAHPAAVAARIHHVRFAVVLCVCTHTNIQIHIYSNVTMPEGSTSSP